MKKVKFLKGIADTTGAFDPGQIIEMDDVSAGRYLGVRYDDGERLAVEVKPTVCPNCGTTIEEADAQPLEAATQRHAPRRRG